MKIQLITHNIFFRIILTILLTIVVLYVVIAVFFSSDISPKNSPDRNIIIHSLNSLRVNAELYASKNNDSYGSFLLDGCSTKPNTKVGSFFDDISSYGADNVSKIINSNDATTSNQTRCFADGHSWATAVFVPQISSWWCVDSNGKSENIGTSTPTFNSTKLCS